jgi:hypothetical protein
VKEERNTFGKSVATLLRDIRAVTYLLFFYPFSLASSKSNLESQISTLSSSQSISSTELDSFRHRVDDIEREKRDLLGVVSRLKEDSAQRDGVFLFYCHICMSKSTIIRGNTDPSCESQAVKAGPTVPGNST